MQAAVVREVAIGDAASDSACALTRPGTRFAATVPQIFVRFVASNLRAGDRLRIDWVEPGGGVATSARYDELPRSSSLCFLSALPVGGFSPATQPGNWQARIVVNEQVVHQQGFTLEGAASALAVRVVSFDSGRLVLETTGLTSETSINLAQYTPSGGWKYLAHVLPDSTAGGRVTVPVPEMPPAEYLVILRSPDGTQSPPARFVSSTSSGYQLPYPRTDRWRVTQGPYGTYSHWGRTQHAYDLAPVATTTVTAMRAGVVSAFDLGLGQTPNRRIFGNYISLRHDDGEYSHYAHLRTGSFLVRTGQRVEAGQALAEAGNSGYSFGRHLHVQVTRSGSISSPSVPFRFSEQPQLVTKKAPAAAPAQRPRWSGQAEFAAWWTRLLSVPRGAKKLEVRLGWEEKDSEYRLYMTSPSGRQFEQDQAFTMEQPEPGAWRVSVQAVRGGGVPFWVEPEVTPGSK